MLVIDCKLLFFRQNEQENVKTILNWEERTPKLETMNNFCSSTSGPQNNIHGFLYCKDKLRIADLPFSDQMSRYPSKPDANVSKQNLLFKIYRPFQ